MAKKPFKGNYLTLENVRIHYNANNDSIQLTSKDKDIPAGESFQVTLNNGREAELILRKMLEDNGMMPKGYLSSLPLQAKKDRTAKKSEWNKIPLGIGRGGQEITWNIAKSPNLMLVGSTGSGKSVIERLIIEHCSEHQDRWIVMAIDLKKVEFNVYQNYANFLDIAITEQKAAASLEVLHDVLMSRYSEMSAANVNNFMDLKNPPRAIMIVIDQMFPLLIKTGIKTAEEIRIDALRDKMKRTLDQLARLGRAAGIHLALAGQRVDSTVFPDELRANLSTRISPSKTRFQASYMLLENDKAAQLPDIRGRGYVQNFNDGMECQFYFTAMDELDIPAERVKPEGDLAFIKTMIELNEAEYVMKSRYADMKNEGVFDYAKLKNVPRKTSVLIDEYSDLMRLSTNNDSGVHNDSLNKKIAIQIAKIARQGRAAGVHILVNAPVALQDDSQSDDETTSLSNVIENSLRQAAQDYRVSISNEKEIKE